MKVERWETFKFQELIDARLLEIGDGYRAKNDELGGDGPIFLRAGHVTDTHIDFQGVERFRTELTEQVQSKMARTGDTIVTTKGNSTGRTSYVTSNMPPFVYSPHLSYWRSLDHNRLVPGFVRYWARGREFSEQLGGMKASTDMAPYLSLTDQRRLRITLPTLTEQQAIAEILGSLDDKIELNRQMNETLEGMARAIFKSWFVDFDPVRAKAAGRQPSGMDADTAAFFPNRFEDSPLGKVPSGWAVVPLPEAFEVNPCRPLSKSGSAPYLDMASMPTRSARALDWTLREVGSGMKFINGDVLVARITPCLENGKTAFVDFLGEGQVGWGSTEYIVLRSKPPLPVECAYFLARSEEFRAHAITNMTGTSGRQRVPASCFDSFNVVVPSASVAGRFSCFASSIIAVLKRHDEESLSLASIRDTLLPKLLSGEISL